MTRNPSPSLKIIIEQVNNSFKGFLTSLSSAETQPGNGDTNASFTKLLSSLTRKDKKRNDEVEGLLEAIVVMAAKQDAQMWNHSIHGKAPSDIITIESNVENKVIRAAIEETTDRMHYAENHMVDEILKEKLMQNGVEKRKISSLENVVGNIINVIRVVDRFNDSVTAPDERERLFNFDKKKDEFYDNFNKNHKSEEHYLINEYSSVHFRNEAAIMADMLLKERGKGVRTLTAGQIFDITAEEYYKAKASTNTALLNGERIEKPEWLNELRENFINSKNFKYLRKAELFEKDFTERKNGNNGAEYSLIK